MTDALLFEAILYALIALGLFLFAIAGVNSWFEDRRRAQEREQNEIERAALEAAGQNKLDITA